MDRLWLFPLNSPSVGPLYIRTNNLLSNIWEVYRRARSKGSIIVERVSTRFIIDYHRYCSVTDEEDCKYKNKLGCVCQGGTEEGVVRPEGSSPFETFWYKCFGL